MRPNCPCLGWRETQVEIMNSYEMRDANIFVVGEHATSLDALWALRDFMLQEALGVVKIM